MVRGSRAQTLGARAVVRHTYANVRCIVLEVNIDLVRTFHRYLPLTSMKLRAYLGHEHGLTRSSRPVQEPGRTGARGDHRPVGWKGPPIPLLVYLGLAPLVVLRSLHSQPVA